MSRFWCLLVASVVDCVAQICGARVENPHMLLFVSALTGCKFIAMLSLLFRLICCRHDLVKVTCALVGYGFLFGVFPSLVVQVFGINGLSTNWGFMTLATVISGNIFNILYGNHPLSLFSTHFWTSLPHASPPLISTPYLYRKDIRFPFDNFTRRNKTMLWIDSLLQCSLLGHIRRLSTQRLTQSVEHSTWQRNQSKSHQTRTRKRHRKGRMRPGAYPFNGELEGSGFRKYIIHQDGYKGSYRRYHRNNIGHRFGLSVWKHVLAWLGPTICFTTGLSPILHEAVLYTYIQDLSVRIVCIHPFFHLIPPLHVPPLSTKRITIIECYHPIPLNFHYIYRLYFTASP